MENLRKLGLIEIIKKKTMNEKISFLGICLGMQLLTGFSEEGNVEGLNLVRAKTIKFRLAKIMKIPHVGWNNVEIQKNSLLFENISKDAKFYFVHSYHVVPERKEDVSAKTKYGVEFVSSIQNRNLFGTQFHPEKSHETGLTVLKNFIENV